MDSIRYWRAWQPYNVGRAGSESKFMSTDVIRTRVDRGNVCICFSWIKRVYPTRV